MIRLHPPDIKLRYLKIQNFKALDSFEMEFLALV